MNTETISVLDFPLPDHYDRDTTHNVECVSKTLVELLDVVPERDVIATDSGLGNIACYTVCVPSQVIRFHVTRGANVPTRICGTHERKIEGRFCSIDIEADLQFCVPDDRCGLVVQYAVTQA